jgi:hypothetical protein
MAARHILVKVEANATPEQKAAAMKKAEGIRAEATPANFAKLAAKSDEPGAGERGGDLGLFGKGMMVPEFEKCVMAIKPGEISPVCATSFGYHVIYRSPYADVAEKFAPIAKQRNVQIAESTYLANVESSNAVELASGVAVKAKAIARNPLGYAKDNGKLATYKSGSLTASEFADWVSAYPPNAQIRPQLLNAPDTLVEKFVRQIVRNELVLYQAKAGGDKAKIAASRVDAFFDKLIKNETQFVDVPYPVARALQRKFSFSINDVGLDKVVEKAKSVRATADSLKAGKGAPAEAPAAAPSPDTTKK